ncbi:MAG: hypothetical protein CAF42_013640 [Nitrospira sp. CG24B]|nr:MAG: hypothetical protein CAF42_013640 [Nitrospira sp. CG24B]
MRDGSQRVVTRLLWATALCALLQGAAVDHGRAEGAPAMSTTLCHILRTLESTVRPGNPLDAQSKWQEALVKAFTDNEFNRKKMAQVKAEVDKLTSASCPKERKAMLRHLDADTLGETVF